MLRIKKVLDKCFYALVFIAFCAIIGVVLIQVIARFALPSAPVWTEELSRYLFIYLIVLSSGLIIQQDQHVKLELFQEKLSPKANTYYQIICHLCVAIFSVILIPYAWQYSQIGLYQTSPTLYIPMVYIFFSTVIFFVLNAFYSVFAIIETLACPNKTKRQIA